jgi:hypothetical protein
MAEEEQQHQHTVTGDLEKGRDGGPLNHTVTISAELYEKVHHIRSSEISDFVALSQSQKRGHRRPPSTFRKSYSPGIVRVTVTNTVEL